MSLKVLENDLLTQRETRVSEDGAGGRVAQDLARSAHLPNLAVLDLRRHWITEAAAALLRQRVLRPVRTEVTAGVPDGLGGWLPSLVGTGNELIPE
ncbi:MAG: hypothetical protein HYS12_18565 [Planctomycetes bacterium]|nr:hypothetical protein [Planctomycetota bacterium]